MADAQPEQPMQLPILTYDPDAVALMGRALDEAWLELQIETFFPLQVDAEETRDLLAFRIITAVNEGEKDLARLIASALDFDG